ncbi:MAG: glycosyltransferase family 39 protein [Chloroflexi bacterium]|nr:glycosyltransferase family 39 protein [Chloroflexota bacterium]
MTALHLPIPQSIAARAVSRPWQRWLVWIFCLAAFGQTMLYSLYLRDDPGNYNGAGAFGDQLTYVALAQQLLHGTWERVAHYMPGYPAVLAFSQLVFGEPRFGVAVLQGLVYALLVLGAAGLASEAFGVETRLWAAGLVALNPALGAYAGQALTEFLTGALLFATVALLYRWSRRWSWRALALAGLLCAGTAYLRSEYLALALVFALVVFVVARRAFPIASALARAAFLLAIVAVLMAPWVGRIAAATGRPGLYDTSPVSNQVLMGTWFRVFDEPTFTRLLEVANSNATDEQAVARAGTIGPRPDLSARYMAQLRGPYDLPLEQALPAALENVRLNLPQYLVNHFALAPVLIWSARTPVRQADMDALPRWARWALWGVQLGLVALALWQAVRAFRSRRALPLALSFLGVWLFLTLVHVLISVDERFTVPALPLVLMLAGARVADMLAPRSALVGSGVLVGHYRPRGG